MGQQGALPVGANLGGLAVQVQIGAHALGADRVDKRSAKNFQRLGEFP